MARRARGRLAPHSESSTRGAALRPARAERWAGPGKSRALHPGSGPAGPAGAGRSRRVASGRHWPAGPALPPSAAGPGAAGEAAAGDSAAAAAGGGGGGKPGTLPSGREAWGGRAAPARLVRVSRQERGPRAARRGGGG